MAVYSTMFFAAQLTAATNLTAYTVPAGKVAVVRDFDCLVQAAGANGCGPVDGTRSLAWAFILNAGALTGGQWRGRQVFVAGEQFGWLITGGNWNVRCSGYLLDA